MQLADQIESYLLECRDWVASNEICELFGVTERQFRQVNNQPGLCSSFAISGDKGFKHVSCATTSEWLHFKHRLRRHGIGEFIRVRDLGRVRRNVTRTIQRPPLVFERDSGQAIMKEILA